MSRLCRAPTVQWRTSQSASCSLADCLASQNLENVTKAGNIESNQEMVSNHIRKSVDWRKLTFSSTREIRIVCWNNCTAEHLGTRTQSRFPTAFFSLGLACLLLSVFGISLPCLGFPVASFKLHAHASQQQKCGTVLRSEVHVWEVKFRHIWFTVVICTLAVGQISCWDACTLAVGQIGWRKDTKNAVYHEMPI